PEAAAPGGERHAYPQPRDLEPTLADAHVNPGRLYHQANQTAEAEAHYRAAARHAPDDALVHFNLAVLLEEVGRSGDAIQAYQRALQADPSFADAHYNLGLLFDTLGKRAQAMTHLRTARKLYGRPATR